MRQMFRETNFFLGLDRKLILMRNGVSNPVLVCNSHSSWQF